MNYTDRTRARSSARARRVAAAKRRRRRTVRRMIALLVILCCVAAGVTFRQLTKKEPVLAVEYETANYNTDIYRGELYAKELCVAAKNVRMKGAPSTKTIKSAALFDIDDQKTLFAYDLYEKVYPASITKLMTALVTLENADLSDTVTVSANADSRTFAWDEQTCGIHAGDQLTLKDLLYGLLVYSGNDNAVAIAEHVGGSVAGFADMMNAKAKEIMATGSHFVNPNGLHDDDHYTTAYDIYLIFSECLKHEEFLKIIEAPSYKVSVKGADGQTRTLEWEATNLYAMGEVPRPSVNKIIGGKTGTTRKAGNCLILLDESESGKYYISLVMGADTKEILYQDMTTLIEKIPE